MDQNVKLKIYSVIMLVTSILLFAGLLFVIYEFNSNLPEVLNSENEPRDLLDYVIVFTHILLIAFHLFAFIYLFIHIRRFSQLNAFRVILIILGILSLFSLGVEKVMIDEVAHEFRMGMDASEVGMLSAGYSINMLFAFLMGYFSGSTLYYFRLKDMR